MQKGYALVTGASSGIGWEMSLQLASRGIPLILVARRMERLTELQQKIVKAHGTDVVCIPADLSQPGSAAKLFAEVESRGLQVDILANNAGVGIQGAFMGMDPGEMERMFQLNIHSLTLLTQLFGQQMVKRKQGHILQVASLAGFIATPYVSAYAATKFYVRAFSEGIHHELRGTGVSLTTLYPGITPTEFDAVAKGRHPSAMDFSMVSAAKVAEVGLRAMFARRRTAVPGFVNKLSLFFQGMIPRSFATRIAGNMLRKENGY